LHSDALAKSNASFVQIVADRFDSHCPEIDESIICQAVGGFTEQAAPDMRRSSPETEFKNWDGPSWPVKTAATHNHARRLIDKQKRKVLSGLKICGARKAKRFGRIN